MYKILQTIFTIIINILFTVYLFFLWKYKLYQKYSIWTFDLIKITDIINFSLIPLLFLMIFLLKKSYFQVLCFTNKLTEENWSNQKKTRKLMKCKQGLIFLSCGNCVKWTHSWSIIHYIIWRPLSLSELTPY